MIGKVHTACWAMKDTIEETCMRLFACVVPEMKVA